MKILHIITTINRGGAENHLSVLLPSLQKFHSISICYIKGDGYWSNHFSASGISVFPLRASSYFDLFAIFRLLLLIINTKPNIIHVHTPPAEFFLKIVSFFLPSNIKVICTKHNDEPFIPKLPIPSLLSLLSMKYSQTIFISSAVSLYFKRLYPHLFLRSKVIHYGIPYRESSCDGNSSLFPDASIVFGMVCRLVPQKDIMTALKAFSLYISDKGDTNALLCIVGSGSEYHTLKQACIDLSISNQVVWAGSTDDPSKYYKSFDVFILSSIYEGFGLVLLEAMSHKLPIIASSVSAIPEVVCDHETSILCTPKCPSSFAKAMHFYSSSNLRHEHGLAGLNRLKTLFTDTSMVEQTLEVYKSLF